MKDLKHLLYFENLLQEAHNDLIAQAQNEGKICVAYACENTPEPLLNLPGAFSTRLRAPRTGSMEMATYYMTSFLCEYSRALLERAIEGGYNFADCMITPDGCSMMNRAVENMELLKTMGKSKPKFFYEYMEIPMKADDNGLNLYVLQCRNHILTPLHEHYGIDVSDAAISSAVAEHNRVCELIRAIGEYRKATIRASRAMNSTSSRLRPMSRRNTCSSTSWRRRSRSSRPAARIRKIRTARVWSSSALRSMTLTSSSSSRRPVRTSAPTASATARSRAATRSC